MVIYRGRLAGSKASLNCVGISGASSCSTFRYLVLTRSNPGGPSDLGPIPLASKGGNCKSALAMKPLLQEIRRNPLLWLLVFVPAVLVAEKFKP